MKGLEPLHPPKPSIHLKLAVSVYLHFDIYCFDPSPGSQVETCALCPCSGHAPQWALGASAEATPTNMFQVGGSTGVGELWDTENRILEQAARSRSRAYRVRLEHLKFTNDEKAFLGQQLIAQFIH